MDRYIVTQVSVGDAGLTQRPAVFDTETGRTIHTFRSTEQRAAENLAAEMNQGRRYSDPKPRKNPKQLDPRFKRNL